MGRRKKEPPHDAAERIQAAAAAGASYRGVAMSMGVGHETMTRWMDERPELREALLAGREKERQVLHSALYERATNPDSGRDGLLAAMFLLKARHGYREGDQEAQANRVSINFQLPGAAPLKTLEVLENGANPVKRLPAAGNDTA